MDISTSCLLEINYVGPIVPTSVNTIGQVTAAKV